MPRKRGSTTEIGLGWTHQQERAAALAAFVEGTPCPLCSKPMRKAQRLDLDHSAPRALGGEGPRRLTHSSCNRRAGAVLGNRMRGAARKGTRKAVTASVAASPGSRVLRHPDLPSEHPANHAAAHPNTSRQAHLPISKRTDLPTW